MHCAKGLARSGGCTPPRSRGGARRGWSDAYRAGVTLRLGAPASAQKFTITGYDTLTFRVNSGERRLAPGSRLLPTATTSASARSRITPA